MKVVIHLEVETDATMAQVKSRVQALVNQVKVDGATVLDARVQELRSPESLS